MWDESRRAQRAIDRYRVNLYRQMDLAAPLRRADLSSLVAGLWHRLLRLGRDPAGEPAADRQG
jgi:hypothetical protein